MEWIALLQILAPIVGPIITMLLKKAAPGLPAILLPIIATTIGAATAAAGGASPVTAVALGGSGVAVREVVDQTKQLVVDPDPKKGGKK